MTGGLEMKQKGKGRGVMWTFFSLFIVLLLITLVTNKLNINKCI